MYLFLNTVAKCEFVFYINNKKTNEKEDLNKTLICLFKILIYIIYSGIQANMQTWGL
jgi:hypothetical protein